jgi:CxxC motif-containing protein (DUF1111 family)
MSLRLRWRIFRSSAIAALPVILALAGLSIPGHFSESKVHAQTGLGGPLPGITSLESTIFTGGQHVFVKLWDPLHGLGPVFTQHGCASCHSQPVPGGNSLQFATLFGKTNLDGSFNPLTEEGGPLLQQLSITKFQPSCVLNGEQVPLDATIVAKHQTPPAFGVGLINSIDDSSILANAVDMGEGIHGTANMVPDENGVVHVGHFGRKAQFVDLIQLTSQAVTHDLGVTNPLVPNEDLPQGQPIPQGCAVAAEPNDATGSQVMATFHYLEYLAPSTPGIGNANGQALFTTIGCAKCHTPSYTTNPMVSVPLDFNGNSITSKALSSQTVTLYSDLLLHDMGPGLADNIPSGQATGSQWKTTPLWGLSLRSSYLHDGRTTNLTTAIKDHGGEASIVIQNFSALSSSDQADLLTFLKSL